MAILLSFNILLLLLSFNFSWCKKAVKEKHRHRPIEDQATSNAEESSHSDQKHLLVIQHAIGKEPFSLRGVVHLRSLKSSKDVIFHQEPLTSTQVKSLQRAALSGELYSIRTNSSLDQEDQSTTDQLSTSNSTVTTITTACALLKSNFNDRIIINGDNKGNIHGLTLLPVLSNVDGADCSSLDGTVVSSSAVSFTSSVSYSTGEPGPSPDTQQFLQKIEEEQAKKETDDNKSFFQKYWLYLLIGFIAFQFLSGAGGAASGGAAAGGGGQ